jgi:hypothetical protein
MELRKRIEKIQENLSNVKGSPRSCTPGRIEGKFKNVLQPTSLFFLLAVMTIIFLFPPYFIEFCEAQALIQVTRSDFCRSIQNREPREKVSGEVLMKPGQELYFWMEFTAGQPALDILEKTGELPIFHHWRKGIVVTDKPNVGMTQEKWLENRGTIRSQVAEKGYFNWRTFSYKQNLESVTYTILMQDGNGDAVTSVGSGKPLRKEIKVSF